MDIFTIFLYSIDVEKSSADFISKLYGITLINKSLNKILNLKLNNYLNTYNIQPEQKPLITAYCLLSKYWWYFARNKYRYIINETLQKNRETLLKYYRSVFKYFKNYKISILCEKCHQNRMNISSIPITFIEKNYKEIMNYSSASYILLPFYLKTYTYSLKYVTHNNNNMLLVPKHHLTKEAYRRFIFSEKRTKYTKDDYLYIIDNLPNEIKNDYYTYLCLMKKDSLFFAHIPDKFKTEKIYRLSHNYYPQSIFNYMNTSKLISILLIIPIGLLCICWLVYIYYKVCTYRLFNKYSFMHAWRYKYYKKEFNINEFNYYNKKIPRLNFANTLV
jgi:hypothetical protein